MKKRKVEVKNLLFHKPVVEKIFSFLNSTQDYFSFRSVCKQTFAVSRAPAIEKRFRGYFRDLQNVQQDGTILQFIKDQTPEICMAAVRQNTLALRFVKEETFEICMIAIQITGYNLQFVKNQTPEICMIAVRRTGYALQFVKEQTVEICVAAVQRTGNALKYVDSKFLYLFK